jgi:hypothetical protein
MPGEALAIGRSLAQRKCRPIGLANLNENELRGLWRKGRRLAFRPETLKMPAAGGISAVRGNGFANLLEATQGNGGFGSKCIIVPTPTAVPSRPVRTPRFVAHAAQMNFGGVPRRRNPIGRSFHECDNTLKSSRAHQICDEAPQIWGKGAIS